MTDILWRERKRNWCGTRFTFTTYTLTGDRLEVKSGLIRETFETVRLYRIVDLTVTRTILQRLFGLGTIVIDAFDQSSHGRLTLKNVPNVFTATDMIRAAVDRARGVSHVTPREYMGMDVDDAANPDGW